MPRIRSGAVFASVLLTISACEHELPISPQLPVLSISIDTSSVPLRGSESMKRHFVREPIDTLWKYGTASESTFTVGFKSIGARRGVWRDRILVSDAERLTADRALRLRPDITIVRVNQHLPMVRVKIASQEALAWVRSQPFVDYIEPTYISSRMLDGDSGFNSGCSQRAYQYQLDSIAVPSGHTVTGWDYFSPQYRQMKIDRAWQYSGGTGVVVSINDTGVDTTTYSEFDPTWFARGYPSGGRGVRTFGQTSVVNGWGGYVSCSHGTRIAGVVGAGRNGRGLAGVAWNASVYSVHQANDQSPDKTDASQAIHDAWVFGHAKVQVLSYGLAWFHESVADEIRNHQAQDDVMFVGAAGTCPDFPCYNNTVFFPAEMEEVLAVSGSNWDGSRPGDVMYGDELDIIAYTKMATTRVESLEFLYDASKPIPNDDIVIIGGSSGSTAVVGGIAALVRAVNPSMTAQQVMTRLINTSGDRCMRHGGWWKNAMVNAEAAVSGFCFTEVVNGPTFVDVTYGSTVGTFSTSVTGGGYPRIEWTNASTGEVLRNGPAAEASSINIPFPKGTYTYRLKVRGYDRAGPASFEVLHEVQVRDWGLQGVTLTGTDNMGRGATCAWVATPVAGTGPFHYSWKGRYGEVWLEGIGQDYYSRTADGAPFPLEVTVTDATNSIKIAGTYVGYDRFRTDCGGNNDPI